MFRDEEDSLRTDSTPEVVVSVTDAKPIDETVFATLRDAGYDVRTATLATDDLPAEADLVVLDAHASESRVRKLVRALKVQRPDVPVLLVAPAARRAHEKARPDSVDGHADAVIARPLDPAELLGAVRALLRIRRTELELQKREHFFRTVIESATDIITVVDADGVIRYESPSVRSILGYAPDELIGQRAFDLVHPEDRPKLQELFRAGREMADATAAVRFRFRHRDGSWRLLEGVGRNLLHDATVRGIVVSSRDVTERAAIDQALRKSEERYRRIVETAYEGVWILDAELRTTYANRRMVEMLGATPEAMPGRYLDDFLDELTQVEARRYLERRQQGIGEQHDFRLRRSDGSELSVIVSASPLFDDTGHFEGVLAMLTDITGRKRVERELEESAAKFRLLFDNNPQPMWLYDAETLRFLEVNDAAVALYGHSRAEFLQMRIVDICSRPQAALLSQDVGAHANDFRVDGLGRHRLKSGEWIDVETVRHSLEFAGRAAELMVVNDVTERHRLADQLRHSQRLDAVGRLAGSIAHDFNNLLTVIIGRARILRDETRVGDGIRRDVELISTTAERAAELTRQLLAFSRKQVLQPELLDLSAEVRTMTAMLRRLIPENIEIFVRAEPEIAPVLADRTQLEQVLINLAVNARDAMPQGGQLRLEVMSTVLDADFVRRNAEATPGPHVALVVSDTGAGISESDRPRIFEPFFTTKEGGKGTGLGLATVYGIVLQHRGCITVESVVGVGSTFTIYLPAAAQAAAPARTLGAAEVGAGGDETILLVEDDTGVRQLAADILSQHGYRVLEAGDAEHGEAIAERHPGPIHLLVTDVVMPKISGRSLADRLMALRPSMKVLFISGYTDEALSRHGVLDPGIALLPKPFTPEVMLERVRRALGDPRRVTTDAGLVPAPRKTILVVVDDPRFRETITAALTTEGLTVIHAANGVDAQLRAEQMRPTAVIVDVLTRPGGGLDLLARLRAFDPRIPIVLVLRRSNTEMERHAEELGASAVLVAPFEPPDLIAALWQPAPPARRLVRPPRPMPATEEEEVEPRGYVLVVDDDAEIRALLANDLMREGYEVATLGDGEQTLTAVIKEEPDLVILDVNMPKLNGIETLSALRAIAPFLQVIIVSGKATPEDAVQARALGAFDFVPKPIDFGYLISRVEAALRAESDGS
jgi:two-component system, cell cycle sensor histidine kinase and response regulator CckA